MFDFDARRRLRARRRATSSGRPAAPSPSRASGWPAATGSTSRASTPTRGAAGNQAFVFGGTGIGRVSLVNSGSDTVVRCNTDKDAAFELELVIEDGGVLAAAYRAVDFIL